MRRTKSILLVLMLAAAAVFWWWNADRHRPPTLDERFRFAEVERGPIEQTVAATGSLKPVTLVNVGTQVSGTIRAVHVDFNQRVRAGQALAEIDPALIEAQLAQLDANLQEAGAQLALARQRLVRTEALVARGFVSGAQRDDERQAVEAARARIRAIQAQIDRERTSLGYTVIRSPIDGVVIDRTVDVGQTVAASFQTPQLFLIARDLRDMQIDTLVAEADIASLRPGMPASFRVDALGDRSFQATVRQIRLNPKIEQNVVTYNVVLSTRNEDGMLLPGMTAAVRIRVDGRADVLKVPSTALRFRPSDPGVVSGTGARAPAQAAGAGDASLAVLHVESRVQGRPVLARVPVEVGISDGSHTELVDAGELEPGARVAVGEIVPPAGERPGGFRLRLF